MSVRGALRKPDKEIKGILLHNDGRPMSASEVRETLFDELSKGHEKIPIGDCDNFDYKNGCQGHEQKEKIEPVNALDCSQTAAHNQ